MFSMERLIQFHDLYTVPNPDCRQINTATAAAQFDGPFNHFLSIDLQFNAAFTTEGNGLIWITLLFLIPHFLVLEFDTGDGLYKISALLRHFQKPALHWAVA